MPKEIVYNEDVRRRLQYGVDQLADTVKETLGPMGHNVILQKSAATPLVTNDGAAITKEIVIEGRVENMGAQVIKQVAAQISSLAGDGSTTAILLARRIIRDGLKNISAGANPMEMKKGIKGAVQAAVAALKEQAVPVKNGEDIIKVASVSADDPAVGEMIADAMERVGMDGVITVDESKSRETTLDVKEGIQFERGPVSPYMFINRERMATELEYPYVLITDCEIADPQEILPLLQQVADEDAPLLIIAEDVKGEALATLLHNKQSGTLSVAAVRPPAYGDGRRARMEDLAILTGGVFITGQMGHVLSRTTIDMLGCAELVRVERNSTTIIGGACEAEAVENRARYLRMLIEKTEYDFDREQLKERLAKLVGGVAVIAVGGITEAEIKEKKLRAEDGLNAARAAVAEGMVPGGGVALANTIPAVRAYVDTLSGDMRTGAAIILHALEEPVRQIAANAGEDGGTVIAEVLRRSDGVGYNAVTGAYTDIMAAGVMDPTKVTRLALENAASASVMLLTVEAGVTELKEGWKGKG